MQYSVGKCSRGFLRSADRAEGAATTANPTPSQSNNRHLQSHSLSVPVWLHKIASAAAQSQDPAIGDFRKPSALLLHRSRISFLCNRRLQLGHLTPTSSLQDHNTPQITPGNCLFNPRGLFQTKQFYGSVRLLCKKAPASAAINGSFHGGQTSHHLLYSGAGTGCFLSTFTKPLSSVMYVCVKAVFQNTASHSSKEHNCHPITTSSFKAQADPGFTAPPQRATTRFIGMSCLLFLCTT